MFQANAFSMALNIVTNTSQPDAIRYEDMKQIISAKLREIIAV